MEQTLPSSETKTPIASGAIRALNLSAWGAAALYFPYINVYFRDIGLSGTQIGLIGMVSALVAALGTMLWGVLTDRLGRPRLLFSLSILGTIIFVLLLGRVVSFPMLLLAAGLFSLFNRPVYTLVDTTTLRLLGEYKERYGAYRVWGTLGFVIISLGSGFLLERTGLHTIFIAFPLAMLVFWLVTLRLPNEPVPGGSLQTRSGVWQMLRQPAWVVFGSAMFILWVAAMGGLGFISVMVRDMGANELQVGWVSTLAAFAEIPLFLNGARILRRFGPTGLITISIAAYGLRLFLYAIAPNVGWALAISLLQSVSYCPFMVGAIAYANDLAPAHLKATSQGVLATVLSLGSLAGTLISGWLYDHVGRASMYTILGITCMAALVIFVVGVRREKK